MMPKYLLGTKMPLSGTPQTQDFCNTCFPPLISHKKKTTASKELCGARKSCYHTVFVWSFKHGKDWVPIDALIFPR